MSEKQGIPEGPSSEPPPPPYEEVIPSYYQEQPLIPPPPQPGQPLPEQSSHSAPGQPGYPPAGSAKYYPLGKPQYTDQAYAPPPNQYTEYHGQYPGVPGQYPGPQGQYPGPQGQYPGPPGHYRGPPGVNYVPGQGMYPHAYGGPSAMSPTGTVIIAQPIPKQTTITVPTQPRPQSYLVLSIITCICFSPLFGLIAICCSSMSDSEYHNGNIERARQLGRTALILSLCGIVISVIVLIIIFTSGNFLEFY